MYTEDDIGRNTIIFGNVSDAVVKAIREMILSGQLRPGAPVSQDELSEQFGVSTMPIREALRRLQSEGLIVFRPRRGPYVRQLSLRELNEIFQIREQLEVLTLRWVADDFDRIPLSKLKGLLEELVEIESRGDIQKRIDCVREIYFTLFSVTEQRIMLRLLSNLWDLAVQYLRKYSRIEGITATRIEHMRNIYRACEQQNLDELIRLWHHGYEFTRKQLILELEGLESGSAEEEDLLVEGVR